MITNASGVAPFEALKLIIAERSKSIVLWCGAGLSKHSGLPLWNDLSTALHNEAVRRLDDLTGRDADRLKKDIEAASCADSLWVAFDKYQHALGPTTFASVIRTSLDRADSCEPPEVMRILAGLPLSGVVSLSLDPLMYHALQRQHSGTNLDRFTGSTLKSYCHVLQNMPGRPFMLQLHGLLADTSSWVLTHNDLRELRTKPGYADFIRTVLMSRVCVFVGLTVDDLAVGGHLEALAQQDIDFGKHYWITERHDSSTRKWTEKNHLQLIPYDPIDNHKNLMAICKELRSAVPAQECAAPPVVLKTQAGISDMEFRSLLKSANDKNQLRYLLNERASEILAHCPSTSYDEFESFCTEFDEMIYSAWYMPKVCKGTDLFGYKLIDEIASGAFGRVFRAEDTTGKIVAIKLLREEVRRKPEMLQGFRRGVRSMKILSDRNVEGMVPYIYATELPTCAVMPFIEGPNLNVAVQQGLLRDWSRLLSVSTKIADTLVRAHGLEERVYHRDLRPANVMIQDGYESESSTWRVVLLDFDLSWHKGAVEQSIVQEGQVSGYLAPEQVELKCRHSTRNALVDSFGIGMLLRFLRTNQTPRHMEHRYSVWEDTVTDDIGKFPCANWHSLPSRYSRLILVATKNEQPDRWDMTSIRDELFRLLTACDHPEKVCHVDMLAEELCCRTAEAIGQRYRWDDALVRAVITLSSGLELVFKRYDEEQSVQCEINWTHKGDHEHKNIRKYLPDRVKEFQASCQHIGWRVLSPLSVASGSNHANGCLTANIRDVSARMLDMSRAIGEGLLRLQL